MGSGFHGGFGNTKGSAHNNESSKTSKKETRDDLITELRNNKVKFSEKDIVFIVRDTTGKIIWLEHGNMSVGLKHILEGANGGVGHAKDFQDLLGISRAQIPSFLKNLFSKGNIISCKKVIRLGRVGYERIYKYHDQSVILTAIGTNGFVVSAYPQKRKEKA